MDFHVSFYFKYKKISQLSVVCVFRYGEPQVEPTAIYHKAKNVNTKICIAPQIMTYTQTLWDNSSNLQLTENINEYERKSKFCPEAFPKICFISSVHLTSF